MSLQQRVESTWAPPVFACPSASIIAWRLWILCSAWDRAEEEWAVAICIVDSIDDFIAVVLPEPLTPVNTVAWKMKC